MKILLPIARKSIEKAFDNVNYAIPPATRKKLSKEEGVFVNLYRQNGELRGSFGYPPGAYPLADGIKRAARGAAFNDRRFNPVTKKEFATLKMEVVLIKQLHPLRVRHHSSIPHAIDLNHGLYITYGPYQTLQLPSFAKYYGFTPIEYLEATLRKVDLAPDTWKFPSCKIYTFIPEVVADTDA